MTGGTLDGRVRSAAPINPVSKPQRKAGVISEGERWQVLGTYDMREPLGFESREPQMFNILDQDTAVLGWVPPQPGAGYTEWWTADQDFIETEQETSQEFYYLTFYRIDGTKFVEWQDIRIYPPDIPNPTQSSIPQQIFRVDANHLMMISRRWSQDSQERWFWAVILNVAEDGTVTEVTDHKLLIRQYQPLSSDPIFRKFGSNTVLGCWGQKEPPSGVQSAAVNGIAATWNGSSIDTVETELIGGDSDDQPEVEDLTKCNNRMVLWYWFYDTNQTSNLERERLVSIDANLATSGDRMLSSDFAESDGLYPRESDHECHITVEVLHDTDPNTYSHYHVLPSVDGSGIITLTWIPLYESGNEPHPAWTRSHSNPGSRHYDKFFAGTDDEWRMAPATTEEWDEDPDQWSINYVRAVIDFDSGTVEPVGVFQHDWLEYWYGPNVHFPETVGYENKTGSFWYEFYARFGNTLFRAVVIQSAFISYYWEEGDGVWWADSSNIFRTLLVTFTHEAA